MFRRTPCRPARPAFGSPPAARGRFPIWIIAVCLAGGIGLSNQELRGDSRTDLNLVIQFYKQERWKLVAETAEEFLQKYPRDEQGARVRLFWAQSLLNLRDLEPARRQFRRFLDEADDHPDRPLARYRIGETSYFLKDYQTAREELDRFLREHPGHDLAEWALLYLAEVQFRLDDVETAAGNFERYLEQFPEGKLLDDAEFGLARAYQSLDREDEAQNLFARIAERPESPRAPEALFNVGARQFEVGQYESAAESFRSVAERYPQHAVMPLAELNAGYALYRLRDYREAIAHFEQAAQDARQRETARYWIGLSHKSLGEYEQAVNVFRDSLQEKPDQPLAENLMFQWGDAELRRENFEESIDLFTQAVRRWPEGELADDALHSATEAAFQLGDLARAGELHHQFEETFPESGLRQVQGLLYGRILIARGDAEEEGKPLFEKAVGVLQEVAETSTVPQTRRAARYQLARAYERMGEEESVVRTLEAFLESSEEPSDEELLDALLLMGNAELRMKNFSDAVQRYQEALPLSSGEQQRPVLAGLAGALTGLEDWERLEEVLGQLGDQDEQDRQFSRVSVAAGDAAFDNRDWNRAESFFQGVVQRGEEGRFYLVALSGMAHSIYEQERFPEAAELFEQLGGVAEEDPNLLSHAAYMHALSLRRAGDRERALLAYQQAHQHFSLIEKENAGEEELPVGMNAYHCAKGGARVARELDQLETADALYEGAYQELKRQPEELQEELDLLINEWAELSYNAEQYDRSDELYSLLISERPESPLADDARLILAESLRFSGKREEAQAAFEKLAENREGSDFVQMRSLVHLLDLAAEGEEWDAVLELTAQFNDRFPDSKHRTYVAYRSGEAHLQKREYERAGEILVSLKEELEANLQQAPAWWPEVWLLIAESFYWLKDYEKLEAVFADLKERAGDSPVLYRAEAVLGRSLENRARFDEARSAYQRVIDSEHGKGTETAAEAQFRIAESYLKQNNYEAALKEYYKVYAGYEAPRYEAAALLQAARCDASLKNWKGAVESYRTLLAEFSDSEFAADAQSQLEEILKAVPELNSQRP